MEKFYWWEIKKNNRKILSQILELYCIVLYQNLAAEDSCYQKGNLPDNAVPREMKIIPSILHDNSFRPMETRRITNPLISMNRPKITCSIKIVYESFTWKRKMISSFILHRILVIWVICGMGIMVTIYQLVQNQLVQNPYHAFALQIKVR